jgi:uncharacterized membrane protein
MTIYAGLKALHLLCAVVWVGGMFFAYVVLRPSMAAIEAPQRMLLHTRVFKKFFLVIWHAMPVIIITGFVMLFVFGNGMAGAPWQIHTMLGLGLLMAAVFLAIFFGPYRQFRRTTDRNRMASSLDTIRKLIGVNLVLGLITVIVGGLL